MNNQHVLAALTQNFDIAVQGNDTDHWYTGLLTSLQQLPADAASAQAFGEATTVAQQADHIRFALGVARARLQGQNLRPDWKESWQKTRVNAQEWADLQQALKDEYQQFHALILSRNDWNEAELSSIITQIAHTAYHAGAVRQLVKGMQHRATPV